MQIAIDVGIPGLVIWVSVLFIVIVAAWQIYRHGRLVEDNWISGLGAAMICSQVILLVHGIVDDVTWGVRPEPILWALWGIAIAAWGMLHVSQAESTPQA